MLNRVGGLAAGVAASALSNVPSSSFGVLGAAWARFVGDVGADRSAAPDAIAAVYTLLPHLRMLLPLVLGALSYIVRRPGHRESMGASTPEAWSSYGGAGGNQVRAYRELREFAQATATSGCKA